MYLTLIRPHLEYASQVWNTSKISETDFISQLSYACSFSKTEPVLYIISYKLMIYLHTETLVIPDAWTALQV